MDNDTPEWFLNVYYCEECDKEWEDEWSCMCNDRCPSCDTEVEPSYSKEISEEKNWSEVIKNK